jgi:YD repeat-containing protein
MMRFASRLRRSAMLVMAPVLVMAGVAGAVASAAAAPEAKAATGPSVLVLLQNGESTAPETAALQAAGYSVTQVTPGTWAGMSVGQFEAYAALVIGDPSSSGSCSSLNPETESLGTNWQAAVTGNLAVLGTAPEAAGTTAASTLVTDSVGYAAAAYDSSSGSLTGLYVSLNCEYSSAPAGTGVSFLDGVEAIGASGGLTVQGGLACTDPGALNTWEADQAGTFSGFGTSSLNPAQWGSGCPVEEGFGKWPAMFTPVAVDAGSDAPQNFTTTAGVTGQPYILLGTQVPAALAPSTGGAVVGGTTSGGTGNPAAPGVNQVSQGNSVNTENGDFSQSRTDLSVAGFGPSLDFTRYYDSGVAQAQTKAGTPGAMGYGWTDNWATNLSTGSPVPGDIYTAAGLRTGNGDGGPAAGSVADGPTQVATDSSGDIFFADTAGNRVQEIAGSTGTQWGIQMTAGDVYTVAGSPAGYRPSFTGLSDGTPDTQSKLNHPGGVAVNSSGLYIADTVNCRVIEIPSASGTQWGISMTAGDIYTVAGQTGTCGTSGDGGSATAAELNGPTGIYLANGNLYIADSANNRIQEVAGTSGTQWGQSMTAGQMYTIAGSAAGTSGQSGNGTRATSALLNDPQGIFVTTTGLYIADTLNCRAEEVPVTSSSQWGGFKVADDLYTIAGVSSSACGTGADGVRATSSDLFDPASVAVPDGNLYIADSASNRVQEVAGTTHTQFGQSMTASDVYTVAGSAAGTAGNSGNGGAATAALLNDPTGVSVDGTGDLYLTDSGNNSLREVTASTADISETAGNGFTLLDDGDGGTAVTSALNHPGATASDEAGDVFIADTANNRVQEIAASSHTQFGISMTAGDVYTVAGNAAGQAGYGGDGGAATAALLYQPAAVAVDPSGNLYIADQNNAAVREVAAGTGVITTFAGTPGASGAFTGGGGPATNAILGTPSAVATDKSGDVFISDSADNEVYEVPSDNGTHYGISMTAGDIYLIAGGGVAYPAAPSGLTVTGTTPTSVSLSWTAPSGTVTGYYVYQAGSSAPVATVTGTTATVTGLTPSTSYTFTVAAYNAAGTGPASASVQATTGTETIPGAPTGLAVTGTTSSSVSLSWTAPSGDVSGYYVYQSGTQVASVTGTTATVAGLAQGITYTFTVAAYNAAGTGPASGSVQATTGSLPGAPTGLAVTGVTYHSVSLSWSAPPGTVTGYYVYKDGVKDTVGLAFSGTSVTVSFLSATTTYTFTVSAYNSGGEGPQSNSVQATTTACCAAAGVPLLAGGNNASGNSGDGGPAPAALLSGPAGLAVDAAGNVYISDTRNNQVREVAAGNGTQWGQSMTTGDIYTIAGSTAGTAGDSGDAGPAAAALLSAPQQVALDAAGDVYIADAANNRVREVAAANGTQWSQSMTAADIYNVAGAANGAGGQQGDGGPATGAEMYQPYGIGTSPGGDLYVIETGIYWAGSLVHDVTATATPSIDVPGSLFPAPGGITITQPGGAQVTFYAQLGGVTGPCTKPYVPAAQGPYCVLPQFTDVSLTQNTSNNTYTFLPSANSVNYTYAASGQLLSEADTAGDTLNVAYATPAPGSGACPSTAASCETVTAASGRSLVIGLNSSGFVTSVTDPMGRSWSYGYSGSQLTSAASPMGHTTSYSYGAGSTGNPALASDLLTITSPDAQPGGPDAGKVFTNVYDASGRVISQTDPMGYTTTFNYCYDSAAGACQDAATGNGLVRVNDPDGNSILDAYYLGTLIAEAKFTGGQFTTETDYDPIVASTGPAGGSLLPSSVTDGIGHTTAYTYDSAGNLASATVPGPGGPVTYTSVFTNRGLSKCTSSPLESGTDSCTQASPPDPVAPGGVITPPSSAPPNGDTYTLYDYGGNEIYETTGVYEPGATSAAYLRTTYQLFNGNTVTLGSTTVSCATSAPSPSLPCATINADGVVTQLSYDAAGDRTGSAAPDGNGSEIATTTYGFDADGEQTSTTAPDGNLPGANAGNYTTVTAWNGDGQKTAVTQAGGQGATVTPRTVSYGYDPAGNQITTQDARGYTTTTTYNADDQATLVTDPDGTPRSPVTTETGTPSRRFPHPGSPRTISPLPRVPRRTRAAMEPGWPPTPP